MQVAICHFPLVWRCICASSPSVSFRFIPFHVFSFCLNISSVAGVPESREGFSGLLGTPNAPRQVLLHLIFVIEGKLLTGELRQRHGIFPVFFDKVKGHDYGLYSEVLAQARYFGIEPLES